MYTVHPSIQYLNNIINALKKSTGRDLKEWKQLIQKSKLTEEKEIRAWLITDQKLTTNRASTIAACFCDESIISEALYLKSAGSNVDKMYAKKADIKPIHDGILQYVIAKYPTIKICPCETIVPLYGNHVIAQIKPATKNRLDFGLALKNCHVKIPAKLFETGGLEKGDRITHVFRLTEFSEFDTVVKSFLDIAYTLDQDKK